MTRFPRVRDVLNKLRHTGQLDHDVLLLVRDRITGVKEIRGDQIQRIGKREFEAGLPDGLGTTLASTIPNYKVTVIWREGVRIWERP
jgi:uncharacterized protein (UPF0248 family)